MTNPTAADKCVWSQEDEGGDTYTTGCGQMWTFTEGTAKDNGMNFCHHCGKPVESWIVQWDNETDDYKMVLEQGSNNDD